MPSIYSLVGEGMDYIQIGKIINTHGIKGEVIVASFTNDVNRFNDLDTIYLGDNKTKLQVEQARSHKNMVLLKFKNFNNINEVLMHIGKFIYVDEVDKRVLPENHFFIFDIIGSVVSDINGEEIGIITDVNQSASNDVYIIRNEKKDKEYLIPAVKEFFVEIDIKNKKIVIDPIEGMIE